MQLTDYDRSVLAVILVQSLGLGLLTLHISHAIEGGENLQTFFTGVLFPIGFTGGLITGGVWLWFSAYNGSHQLRVAAWSLLGALLLAVGAVMIILHEQIEGFGLSYAQLVIADAASAGGLAGFILGIYDVRQRRARERAERVSQRLTVLNRVLRHDIRNTGNVIHGWATKLSDQNHNNDISEVLQHHASKLVELGEHAQDIDKLASTNAARRPIDITDIIKEELHALTQNHPTVELETSLNESSYVYAHPSIDSAIKNILENAIDHNDTGHPIVQVESHSVERRDGERIRIEIADNGPGMTDEALEVLKRGYETPLEHLSGLGLWLVHWIVRESQGDVWIEPNSPHGTVVNIEFDAAPVTDS